MNRSHLIPEQRTSKNGVASVKWVKPEGTAGAPAKPLPAPEVGKPKPLPEHADNSALAKLLYPVGYSDVGSTKLQLIFDMIREDDSEVMPFVYELITTGPEIAQKLARSAFRDDISGIAGASSSMKTNQDWMDLCSWGVDITSNVMASWSCGSVLEELNEPLTNNGVSKVRSALSFLNGKRMRSSANVFPYSPVDTQYWRGLTALELSQYLPSKMSPVGADEMVFIAWAGNHPRIDLVIKTARDRKSIDIGALSLVIDSEETPDSLREGIL